MYDNERPPGPTRWPGVTTTGGGGFGEIIAMVILNLLLGLLVVLPLFLVRTARRAWRM